MYFDNRQDGIGRLYQVYGAGLGAQDGQDGPLGDEPEPEAVTTSRSASSLRAGFLDSSSDCSSSL